MTRMARCDRLTGEVLDPIAALAPRAAAPAAPARGVAQVEFELIAAAGHGGYDISYVIFVKEFPLLQRLDLLGAMRALAACWDEPPLRGVVRVRGAPSCSLKRNRVLRVASRRLQTDRLRGAHPSELFSRGSSGLLGGRVSTPY